MGATDLSIERALGRQSASFEDLRMSLVQQNRREEERTDREKAARLEAEDRLRLQKEHHDALVADLNEQLEEQQQQIEELEIKVFGYENPDSPLTARPDTAADAAGDDEHDADEEEEDADAEFGNLDGDEEVEYYRQQTIEAETQAEEAQEKAEALEAQLAKLQREFDKLSAAQLHAAPAPAPASAAAGGSDDANDKLSMALAEAAKLRKEKKLMITDYQALQAKMDAEVAKLNQMLAEKTSDADGAAKRAREQKRREQNASQSADDMKMQLVAAQSERDIATDALRALQRKFDALQRDSQGKAAAANGTASASAEELQREKDRNAELKRSNLSLQRSLEAATAALSSPSDSSSDAAGRVSELEASLRSLRASSEASDAEAARLRKELDLQQAALQEMQRKHAATAKRGAGNADEMRMQVQQLQVDNNDLQQRLAAAEAKVEGSRSAAADQGALQSSLAEARRMLDEALSHNEASKADSEFARLRMKELEREIERLLRQLTAVKAENKAYELQLQSRAGDDSAAKQELAARDEAIAKLQNDMNDMAGRYKRLQNRVENPHSHSGIDLPDAGQLAEQTVRKMRGEYHHDFVLLADLFGEYEHKIARLREETLSLQTVVNLREDDVGGSLTRQFQLEKDALLNEIAVLKMQMKT